MNTRGAWWTTLAFGWLASAAIGCSDEKTSSNDSANETAAPSKASGAAGRSSPMRDNVSADECVTLTEEAFSKRSDGYSSDCVTCLCGQNPKTVALCDDQADICWGLVICAGANCAGTEGLDEANCAIEKCGKFIEGSGLAMSIGVLLRSDTCSAKCQQKH